MKAMIVSELIELLQTYPQDMPVARTLYSEQRLLKVRDLEVVQLCEARDDGWIQNRRPDKDVTPYLLIG